MHRNAFVFQLEYSYLMEYWQFITLGDINLGAIIDFELLSLGELWS